MPESFDIFISYKREDQAFAEILRERITAWGYTAWMDKYNIPVGAYWPDEIDQGLNASKVVIGVLSTRAVASRNVKNEWDWSIINGKRLLLLMIEPCVIPMNYVSINYIDCVKDQAAGLARLQAALTDPTSSPLPADPYRDYLQALYNRINTYLAQTIIKVRPDDPSTPEPISLQSERTRGAVDALFEKRDEIDPLFMIGGVKQEMAELDGDFRKAFDYFDGRVLLLGEPGAGKTITLLHFGRDAVVQRIQDPAKSLPVLAIIPTWDAEKQTPLAEWLTDSYGAPPDVARIVAEGRALLLLDGLDELGSERENPETKERYDPRRQFMGIIPLNNQVIVTCRVKDYEEIGEKITLNGAVTLQKLTDAQICDYLSAEVPDLWVALEADEELFDVARTPLLLSLFAFGYKDQGEEAAKLRDLRASPGDLRDAIFGQYVKQRYAHEARKLQLRHPSERLPFFLDEIYEVLGHAAMWNAADWTAIENVLDLGFDLPDERLPVFTELATRLHLLIPIEDEMFSFIHLLLRDHFGFPYALRCLCNADADERDFAIKALGKIGDPRAVGPLIVTLADSDETVSLTAASALERIGTFEALVAISRVGGNILPVRRRVARQLGEIGDVRAVEPLIENLRHKYGSDGELWSNTAWALGEIGAPAVEMLINALSDTERWWVRGNAAHALGKIGDTRSIGPLITLLRDTNEDVLWHARIALEQIGIPAVEVLIAALHDGDASIRRYSAKVLGRIGDDRAVEPLIIALDETEKDVRWAIVEALGDIGDIQAFEPLAAALSDADQDIRMGAARSLWALSDRRAVKPLIISLNDVSADVRSCAADALGEIGDETAVSPLVGLLSDTAETFFGGRVCDAAARALERIDTPEALGAVEAWRQKQNRE